jgi:DNA-binding NarL/FixJ family response regulator
MKGCVIIASTAAAIVETVERSVREVCPHIAIECALNEVDFHCLIDSFEEGHIFLESNFCEIATAYLMAQKLSDNSRLRFVIFSFTMLTAQDMGRFYNLGAVGFLDFRSGKEGYKKGIAEVMEGNEFIPREAEKALKDFRVGRAKQAAFTIREIQVLRHTARGKSLEEIAEILSLTLGSVQNIKTQVYQKAGIKNNVQIMLFALSMGYVTLNELAAHNKKQGTENRELSIEDGREEGLG